MSTKYDVVIERLSKARDARRPRLLHRLFSSRPGGFVRRLRQHSGRLARWVEVETRADATRMRYTQGLAELAQLAALAAMATSAEREGV